MDDQANAKPGLTDAELANHPTVYTADALKGQVVIVSGGSGGIGRAIAWLFARLGAHVVVVGRNQAKLDIRVNCVAPGVIETEGWNVYTPQARAAYPRANPMMRAGSPWDIAEACVYLAGPPGKFVTGETLTADGGGQLWGETWTTGKPDYFGGDH